MKRAPGQRRAGFEIHAQWRAEIGVFLRLEVEFAWASPARNLYVRLLIRAIGHVLGGEVGKAGEQVFQLRSGDALDLFLRGHRFLDRRDLGLEHLCPFAVALGHRLADQLAGLVAPVLRLLKRSLRLAPLGVEFEDAGALGLRPATLQAGVEGLGIGADESDIVHGARLCLLAAGMKSAAPA